MCLRIEYIFLKIKNIHSDTNNNHLYYHLTDIKRNHCHLQLSLCHGLDPAIHVAMGRALRALLNDGVLILGSGLSFHNMRALVSGGSTDERNEAFENWLADTCASPTLTTVAREQRLINWAQAPHARYCHPREEHLLPLHVCFGAAGEALPQLVSVQVLGKRASAFLW